MSDVKIDWFGDEVSVLVEKATQKIVDQLSLACEAQTKTNITRNGQVDTGFMRSSAWSSAGGGSGRSGQSAAGRVQSAANRSRGSVRGRGRGASASAGVSANYAIYNEIRIPFLYPALQSLKGSKTIAIVAKNKIS